ncbi:MAG: MlaD family protein [Bacteroidota bacterium]
MPYFYGMKHAIQFLLFTFLVLSCSVGGNTYYLSTPSAEGLQNGDLVVRQGVVVGKVTDIGLDGRKAKITVQLESGTELYEGQHFSLGYHDGEKAIEFSAPALDAAPLADGATLEQSGFGMGMDDMLEGLGAGLENMMEGLGSGLEGLGEGLQQMTDGWGQALQELNLQDSLDSWGQALEDLEIDGQSLREMVEEFGDSIRINGQSLEEYLKNEGAELREQLQEL